MHGNKITGMLMKVPKRKSTQAPVKSLLTYQATAFLRGTLKSCFYFDSDGKCQLCSGYYGVVPD